MAQLFQRISRLSTTKLKTDVSEVSIGLMRKGWIHHWVRPTRYVLHRRRKQELWKHPERAKPPRRSTFSDWDTNCELYAFGKRLGEEFDKGLLAEAMIDSSHVQEERKRLDELGVESSTELKDNSELALHGLKVLNQVLTSFLKSEFPNLPEEGVISITRHLTSTPVLYNISSDLGSKDLIQSDVYPPTEEVCAKNLQAIIGALDKSTPERSEKFVVDFIASYLCGKDISDFWDIPKPWHMLRDITKSYNVHLEPRLLREVGRNTLLSAFVVGIYDDNKKLLGTGIGETLEIAQEMAARDVLHGIFGTRGPIEPFHFQSANYPFQLIPHVRNP